LNLNIDDIYGDNDFTLNFKEVELDKLKEFNAVNTEMFKYNQNINVVYNGIPLYFNTNVILNNTINIQHDYILPNNFCDSILLDSNNLQLIKNYYNLNDYVLTFLTARIGHWHCVIVYKLSGKVKILFLSSVSEYLSDINNTNIFNNIINVINKNSFVDFINNYFNCMTTDDSLSSDFIKKIDVFMKNARYITDFKNKLIKIIKFYINPMKCKELYEECFITELEPDAKLLKYYSENSKLSEYKNALINICKYMTDENNFKDNPGLYREILNTCNVSLKELQLQLEPLDCEIAKDSDNKPIKAYCDDLKQNIDLYLQIINDKLLGLVGGNYTNYKEKYLKYKTKYIKLKSSVYF
jgi:hypothetical protein